MERRPQSVLDGERPELDHGCIPRPKGFIGRWLRHEGAWLLVGIALAIVWFCVNRSLPPFFRGDVCCDSTQYVSMAQSKKLTAITAPSPAGKPPAAANVVVHMLGLIFADTGYRTIGYPAYLALHRYALQWLGLGALLSFVTASAITALLLHILAMFLFYRTIRTLGIPLHPVALTLMVAHPGMTSIAALPMSDSLGTSLLLFAVCALAMTIVSSRKRAMWYALLTGFLFAAAVWIRPGNLLPCIGTFVLWIVAAGVALRKLRVGRVAVIAPIVALAVFAVVLMPRVISCTHGTGHVCFTPEPQKSVQEQLLLGLAMRGARTYTVLWSGKLAQSFTIRDAAGDHAFGPGKWRSDILTIPDPMLMRYFGSCPIGLTTATHDAFLCLARGWVHLPEFFLKKAIGLFDNFHWNMYATYVTPLWVLVMNRTFGAVGFSGFVVLFGMIAARWIFSRARVDEKTWALRIAVIFPLLAFGAGSLVAIESRYGFPLTPFGLAAAVFAVQCIARMKKRDRILPVTMATLLVLVFLAQTYQWDRIDTFPRISLQQALNGNP